MNTLKQNGIPIGIAFVQWVITTVLQIDRFFFSYDYISGWMIATKILYFIFLVVAWCFGFHVFRKIKSGDERYQRGFWIFLTYFVIMLCFLAILWPGTWAWDDLLILLTNCGYHTWSPWQHVITGAYQDVLLQILPFPGGIILLQNMIISVCVAFSITKIEGIFGIQRLRNKVLDMIVKLLPFLLPPVLMYQFSGYRMGLYVYLELVMLVMLVGAWKEKEAWSKSYLCLFVFLGIIISTWRTESLFYVPCICFLMLFIKKAVISNKKKLFCVILLVIGFLGINKFQSWALGNSNYTIISLMRPCAELVRSADAVDDAEELAAIDKVAKLDVIYNNPTVNGEGLYWSYGVLRQGYSDEDYNDFFEAFIQLSIKYPKVVFAERWNLFIKTSGITGEASSNVRMAAILYEEENGFYEGITNSAAEKVKNKGWIANEPICKDARRTFINILGMRRDDDSFVEIPKRMIWNALVPIGILLVAWIVFFAKKKWYLFGVCTAVLIRVPVVVLTQPSDILMYMLSFYFLGYVLFVYYLLLFWSKRKERKEQKA